MKRIGRTDDGNVLVEMSAREAGEFQKLGEAIEGEFNVGFSIDAFGASFAQDYSTVFGMIRVFYLSRYAVTELKSIVDGLHQKLSEPSE